MEFKVINEQLPVIAFNFDELKGNLANAVEKYSNLVVTEDNLSDCKAIQKDLAGVRRDIDKYRLDKKKELLKPITDFENQCKQLIDVIENVERSIKEGTNVFDQRKRDEKRTTAEILIKHSISKFELNAKYATQLTVSDKYTNLTAKEKEVAEDIDSRATLLKQQQTNEEQMLEIIKDTIENANKNINAKMSMADFQRLISQGISTKEIMQEINSRADRIKQAEIEAEEQRIRKEEQARLAALAKEQEQEELKTKIDEAMSKNADEALAKAETKPVEPIVTKEIVFAEIRIVGTTEQTAMVGQFLRDNNIQYSVMAKGKVE